MAESRLSIGVVLPTLNVRVALPEHLATMRAWLGLVEEVVVVDSFSTDGTFELLQAELRHPHLRLFQCPPGLYQAWNYGLERLTARFTYISTVGDPITAEGLRHLAATADELGSDVVISRPEFLDADGRSLGGRRWPIHDLLDWCAASQPRRVEPWKVFLAGTLAVPQGILGSSASNLYRTSVLQRTPFQVEYGHEADTAWGIAHAFDASWAVTPRVFSKFKFHSGAGLLSVEKKLALVGSLLDLAGQTIRRSAPQVSPASLPEDLLPCLRELPEAVGQLGECQNRYDQARHRFRLWSLHPEAWQARAQRNRRRARLQELSAQIRAWSA
jgi:hypothetical protein